MQIHKFKKNLTNSEAQLVTKNCKSLKVKKQKFASVKQKWVWPKEKEKKKIKHFMSQENQGNHQTSSSNNIMCESSWCKNTISNSSNPKMESSC